jgi:hypothetical protein
VWDKLLNQRVKETLMHCHVLLYQFLWVFGIAYAYGSGTRFGLYDYGIREIHL